MLMTARLTRMVLRPAHPPSAAEAAVSFRARRRWRRPRVVVVGMAAVRVGRMCIKLIVWVLWRSRTTWR